MDDGEWTHGLLSCANFPYCLMSSDLGLCAMAWARHRADGTHWCLACLIPPCVNRQAIRKAYGITGTCCGDWVTTSLCPICAIAQAFHESRIRGRGNSVGKETLIEHEPQAPKEFTKKRKGRNKRKEKEDQE